MLCLSIASIIVFLLFKSHEPDLAKRCGTGNVSCDCTDSYTLYEISYLVYTGGLFARWLLRALQFCYANG